MILKLTVKDNDFSYLLKRYLNNFHSNITIDIDFGCKGPDKYEKFEEKELARRLLNPNCYTEYTIDDAEFLRKRIRSSFEYFVNKVCPKDVEYLMKNLGISFPRYFEDKWENGESVYWMMHSNTVIEQ